jgi:ubiquinone/menaquinone biosynthesis C-methylase UbiE
MKSLYHKEIGYSPLANVDYDKLQRLISTIREVISGYYQPRPGDKILSAGAGEGGEAALLHNEFKLLTVGIDLNIGTWGVPIKNNGYYLQRHDITSLAFRENSFSLVYCYHVLEHVEDPIAVLKEIHRVLTSDGILFIGFPNRHRVFAYVGTSQRLTTKEKILWNLNDYRFRLTGKFENKYGAHAGFTESEYTHIASRIFRSVIPVRNQYMLLKYKRLETLVYLMIKSRLSEFLFPSNYFICLKSAIS